MACLEHNCSNPKCNWMGFSNGACPTCPRCGSLCHSTFDEDPRDHDDGWRPSDEDEDGRP